MTAYADLLRKQKEQHTENAETRMNEAVEKYRKALQEEAAKLNKGAQDSYQNFRPTSETSASASRGAYLNRMAAVNAAQSKASGALGAYGSYYSALYQGKSADTDAAITNIEKKDQEAQDAIAAYQQAVRKAKSRSYRKTTRKSSGETAQLTDGGQTTNNGSTTHVSSSGVTHGGSSGKLNLPTTGKNVAYQAKLSTSSLSSKLKAGEITQAKTPSAKTATKTATVHGGSSGTIKSELATARSNLIKSLTLSALAGDSRTPDMVTAAVSAQTQYQNALDNQNQKIADAKKNLEAYKKPQRHPDTNTPFASQDDTAYNVKVLQNYLDAKAAWTDPNEIKLLTSNINNILSSDVYMTPEQRAGYMATVEELRRQEKDQVNAVDLWNQTAKAVKLDAGTASLLDTYNDAYDKRSYYNNYQDPGEAETEWNKSEATMAEIRDAFMREGYTEEQFKALAEMRRQKTNAEKQQARNELNAAYAEKYPILATLISTPASLISGSGLVDMGVDNALGYSETFAPNLDVNSEYFRMANFASTERQAVSKDMGKFAKFMYDVGTSGLDSLAAAAISSGLPGFGEFLLGSGAAVQEMMDVTSRGGTTQQAVTAGMAAGAFESIFEHVSIENLEALKEMPVRTAKDWVLNMLKSAVTNFEEEAATEVADIVSEYLIAGDVSEAAQTYEYYLSKGMSEQEASRQTAIDLAEQVVMSGVSGAVMGVGFGAMSGVNAFRGQETTQTATLTPEQIMDAIAEAFSGTQILNNVTEQIRDMDPSQASPILSEAAAQMHAATEASIAEAERIIEERAAQQVSTDTVTVETLGEKTQTDRQAWTEEFNQSRRIGSKLNIDVRVNEGYRGTNTHGSIYFNDNNGRVVIEVAPDANSPMQVMKHELTHYIENSSYYDSISSYITDILSSQMAKEGRTLSDLEALIREDYRSAGYELNDKDVRHELIAKYVEENLFTSQSAVDALVEYDKPAARGILGWIHRMISRLKGEDVDVLNKAEKLFIQALNNPGTVEGNGIKYSANTETVKKNMSDDERSMILKSSKVSLVPADLTKLVDSDYESVNTKGRSKLERNILEIAEKLKVFGENKYENDDINIEFGFSRNNVKESIRNAANNNNFLDILANIDEITKTAIPIKIQDDRYKGRVYQLTNIKNMFILLGALDKGDTIIPVKLEIKEFEFDPNNLYVYVDADEIKKEADHGTAHSGVETTTGKTALPASTHSVQETVNKVKNEFTYFQYGLQEIVSKVNNGSLLKYFPDSMLTDDQIKNKKNALLDEEKHTLDKIDRRYGIAVSNNNIKDADTIVELSAKHAGYDIRAYHGGSAKHDIFDWSYIDTARTGLNHKEGFGFYFTDNKDMADTYGKTVVDCYIKMQKPFFGDAKTVKKSEIRSILNAIENASREEYDEFDIIRNNYDVESDGYKACFNQAVDDIYSEATDSDMLYTILSMGGAQYNAESIRQYYDIITETTGRDGIQTEWDNGTVYVVFDPKQIKSADTVVRDDNGEIIPPSRRFDPNINDTRFSFGKSLSEYTREVNTSTPGTSGTTSGSIKTGQKEWASDNLTREVISRASGTTPNGIKTDQSVLPKIDYNRALAEGTQRPYVNKNAYTLTQKARVALVDKDASLYDYRQKHSDSLIYEKKTLINSKATITAAAIGAQTGNRTTGMQLNAQMEPVGESLATIISDIKKDSSLNGRGMDLMQDYLYNKLNIERAATEKTFTGEAPTEAMRAADSERIVRNIETQYPAIKDHAAKVRKFLDNNLQFMVDTGTVSADLADKLKGMYPDYLPVMMNDEGSAEIDFSNYTDQLDKQLVKYAKGGNVDLMNWDKAIEKYTRAVYSQGFNNQMLNEIVAAAMNDPEWARHNVKILAVIPGGNAQTARQLVESNNSGGDNVYAAINGDSAVVFGVSDYLNSSVRTLAAKSKFQFDTNTDSNITNALGEVGNYFVEGGYMRDLNSLVTTYKPPFFLSNPMRDLGDLLVNSPHLQETLASYPTAWAEVFSNSEGYQRFVAIMSNDILTPDTKTNAVSEKFTEISQATELVTRYAEYLGGIKTYGDTYEGRVKALYDAKEATVNFGRSGEVVQKANQYAFRFLNAGVQGIDKMVRNITERKNTGALMLYTLRAAALGASPLILNALLWHDDDDFEQLTDSMKSKNLYLFKTNEGKFMGIPLGRTNSAISRAILYAADVLNGKEKLSYAGFTSMLQDVWDNVGIDVGSSFILSPIFDAIRNKTWYGGQIESDYEQDKPASERYDSSTDYLSRWIGKQTGWSPKKINYVLDQYGGVLFDYTFPLFTPETMGQNAYELAVEPVIKRFSADPVYSNDIGSDFNTAFRDSEQNRNSANPPAGSELVYKYMNAQKSAANKLYKEIDKINNFRDLSEEEQQALIDTYGDLKTYKARKEAVRALRITINGIKKNAVAQYDTVKAKAAEYSDYSDKEGCLRLNHDLFGAEYALKYYSMDDYAYAVTGAQGGMDYETYYQYMLNTTGIYADKDKNGRSINGSKKQKYIDYISGLDISLGEKAFLLAREYPSLSNAYTPSLDSKKWKRALFDYVNSMDISSEVKKTILEQYDCFEVDSKGNVKIH